MRIRLPFAGTFFVLLLLAAYVGLTPLHLETYINDKALHFLTFFLLTLVFYWIVDTNRRRTLNLTLAVCTGALGVGSEFLQALLPNGRTFDPWDIAANVAGSLSGLALCTWYHKRMLERRRAMRGYGAVPAGGDVGESLDLELGEAEGSQEEGIITGAREGTGGGGGARTLEEEVDNWDENAADDWDDDQRDEDGGIPKAITKQGSDAGAGDIAVDGRKRND